MTTVDRQRDLHEEGIARFEHGDASGAFELMVKAAADANRELIGDLGVVARSAAGAVAASAALQTAALLGDTSPELRDDLRFVEAERARGFAGALLSAVIGALSGPLLSDTVDALRFPKGLGEPRRESIPGALAALLCSHEHEWLYERLDRRSQALMAQLLAYRIVGHRHVPLPLTGARHRELIERARSCMVKPETVDLGFLGHGDRYDLSELGYPVVVDAHVLNIEHCFLLEQYRHPNVAVAPGDIVVDGGGCWGDTALYFAHLAGPDGRIVTFEFEPSNLDVLERNLARNPELAARVAIERRAVWSVSDEALSFSSNGPGSKVGGGGADATVLTRAIDDLPVDRVDFIKLDVEGAELAALHGAEQTIRRCRPRIAAAIYHRPDDWVDLPRFLDGLALGYRFALGHFTMHAEETVLFAWCDADA
jgi:FkbM family methyltransferase